MGKKRTSSGYTSKGVHCQKRSYASKANRRAYKNTIARLHNQYVAFSKGKNVMLTIENPNKNETNKRFIRVNAREVWKSPNRFNNS
tara:strand:+ start:657 stop:914 length:258 start_codon:yes stop_codon:yes gene_type:complete